MCLEHSMFQGQKKAEGQRKKAEVFRGQPQPGQVMAAGGIPQWAAKPAAAADLPNTPKSRRQKEAARTRRR